MKESNIFILYTKGGKADAKEPALKKVKKEHDNEYAFQHKKKINSQKFVLSRNSYHDGLCLLGSSGKVYMRIDESKINK